MSILKNMLPQMADSYYKACVYAILHQKDNMLSLLKKILKQNSFYKYDIKEDPDFESFRHDPDLISLISH